jgi:hypothetical protein
LTTRVGWCHSLGGVEPADRLRGSLPGQRRHPSGCPRRSLGATPDADT